MKNLLLLIFLFGSLRLPLSASKPVTTIYRETDGEQMRVIIRQPAETSDNRSPGIILIHGGGWFGGSPEDDYVRQEAERLSANGYITFAISYRTVNLLERLENQSAPPKNRFPACLDDCQFAIRWIRSKADQWNLDPDRIAAIGWSAGAHLAALLGTMETRGNDSNQLQSFSSRVNAAIPVCGPMDFTKNIPDDINIFGKPIIPDSSIWWERNPIISYVDELLGTDDPEARKAASPQYQIDPTDAPFLIIQGGADPLIPEKQGNDFLKALLEADVPAELLTFPDEGHSISKPENRIKYHAAIDAFLAKWLKPKPD